MNFIIVSCCIIWMYHTQGKSQIKFLCHMYYSFQKWTVKRFYDWQLLNCLKQLFDWNTVRRLIKCKHNWEIFLSCIIDYLLQNILIKTFLQFLTNCNNSILIYCLHKMNNVKNHFLASINSFWCKIIYSHCAVGWFISYVFI